jgi:hypothetical protein
MPPTPLHGPGARRRFARQLREAALRSTDCELPTLDVLEAAVRAGDISVLEGSERVRLILREQHARRDEQAAA